MLTKLSLTECRFFFDFDNTITTSDVLDDVIRNFSINDDWISLEKDWVKGKIGTKECLREQLKNVRVSQKDLRNFLKSVKIDPYFSSFLAFLNQKNVQPVILSDNFVLIIRQILENHGIENLPIFANRLDFFKNRLIPFFPYDNPACPSCAHCKKTHLTEDKIKDSTIVYVGDGRSDLCAARVSDIVFAKDSLLYSLKKEGKPCLEYNNFNDIYQYLTSKFSIPVLSLP